MTRARGSGSELSGFLAWLRAAEEREDLSPRPEDPGAWHRADPHDPRRQGPRVGPRRGAAAGRRRAADRSRSTARTAGSRSGSCRGRSAATRPTCPVYDWESATTRKELLDNRDRFKAAVGQRAHDEERRLAYVAVTRARHELLLSGSFWATQTKPPRAERVPARPGDGRRDRRAARGAARARSIRSATNLEWITWPMDPLGRRRPAVEAAAAAVRAAEPAIGGPWAHELELLLTERARRLAGAGAVSLPTRVPASRFKDFVTDPDAVASSLLRPMPEKPFKATRLGTLFHSWVENRYGLGAGSDELDAGPSNWTTRATASRPPISRGCARPSRPRSGRTAGRSRWSARSTCPSTTAS